MKSVSKKLLSIIMAVLMVVSFSAVAFADDADFDYFVQEDGTYSVAGFFGDEMDFEEEGVFVLPYIQPLDEVLFTSVEPEAFRCDEDDDSFLSYIVKVVVPANIKNIGDAAFRGLPALETVVFEGDIVLDKAVFADCAKLKSVEFKGNAKVGENAFYDCAELESVTFGKNVELADNAFGFCSSLKNISVNEGADIVTTKSALDTTRWFEIGSDAAHPELITLGTTLVAYKGSAEEVTVPETITAIGDHSFAGNEFIKKVVIFGSVDKIGKEAFAESTLETFVYPEAIEFELVDANAFRGTPFYNAYENEFFSIGNVLLKYKGNGRNRSVRIPATVTEIADEAFLGCYTVSEDGTLTYTVDSIFVPVSIEKLSRNSLALAKLEDGTYYYPEVNAYAAFGLIDELRGYGYNVGVLNNPADVDGNGTISIDDARATLRISLKTLTPTQAQFNAADVDNNGVVSVDDARLILRMVVKLAGYSAEDLLSLPKTELEILQAYAKAMKTAATGAGFTRVLASSASADINLAHEDFILGLANTGAVNEKKAFSAGTQEAFDAVKLCSLASVDAVRGATCTLDKNNNYIVTIVLKDVNDATLYKGNETYVSANNEIGKIMPIVSGETFYQAFANSKTSLFGQDWFGKWVSSDDKITSPCVRYYSLDYVEPIIKATFDKDTYQLSSVKLSVKYKFAVDGRIGLFDISGKGFKVGNATVTRTDTVRYTDFTF